MSKDQNSNIPKFTKFYGPNNVSKKLGFKIKSSKYHPDGSGRDYLIAKTVNEKNFVNANPTFVKNLKKKSKKKRIEAQVF